MTSDTKVCIKSISCETGTWQVDNKDKMFSNLKDVPLFWWKFWGVKQRGYFNWKNGENETTAALAAAKRALEGARLQGKNIDIAICSATFPIMFGETNKLNAHRMLPRLSAVLKEELGIFRGIDTQADCLSFLANLELAASFIKLGLAKNILVCSSEYSSASLDMVNPVSTIFGDGAAAAVVSVNTEGEGNLLASSFHSDATHYKVALGKFQQSTHSSLAKQDEKYWPYFNLEKSGADKMKTFIPFEVPKTIKRALIKAQCKSKDVDYFIFHQPSSTIVKAWAMGVGISKKKYCLTMDKHGVLGSVSIPMTLYHALKEEKMKSHGRVVLAGAATGWNFGAQVWDLDNLVAC